MSDETDPKTRPSERRALARRQQKQDGRARRAEYLHNKKAKERARQDALEDRQSGLEDRVKQAERRLDAYELRLAELEDQIQATTQTP